MDQIVRLPTYTEFLIPLRRFLVNTLMTATKFIQDTVNTTAKLISLPLRRPIRLKKGSSQHCKLLRPMLAMSRDYVLNAGVQTFPQI